MAAPNRMVTTATLIRGQLYTMRHPDSTPQAPKDSLRFVAGKPVVIEDKKIVDILENLYDEVTDGEGEVYEKPRFRIDRNVPSDSLEADNDDLPKPQRLSPNRKPIRRRRA